MVQPLTLAGGNSKAVNTTQKVKREAVSGKNTQNEKTVLFIAFWHQNSGVSTVLHFPVLTSSLEICCRGVFVVVCLVGVFLLLFFLSFFFYYLLLLYFAVELGKRKRKGKGKEYVPSTSAA